MGWIPHVSWYQPGYGLEDETLPTAKHAAAAVSSLPFGCSDAWGEGFLFRKQGIRSCLSFEFLDFRAVFASLTTKTAVCLRRRAGSPNCLTVPSTPTPKSVSHFFPATMAVACPPPPPSPGLGFAVRSGFPASETCVFRRRRLRAPPPDPDHFEAATFTRCSAALSRRH